LRRTVCIILLLILLAPVAGARGPKVKTTYEYYDIGGKSAPDIRKKLNSSGVRWTDGKVYDAVTRWYVRWNFRYENVNGRCRIASVVTHVDVVIKMPRWTGHNRADERLKDRWTAYIRALHEHELGHRGFGVRAAAEIEEVIARLEPQADCVSLGAAANAAGHRILDKYRREEIAYDRDTRHGITQGAVFP
jgi:predicted secreted Zn-dependent protease